MAAEFSDGCHHALSYTREAYDYMIEHCTIGAQRAGKNVQDLDLGAWIVFSVAEDGGLSVAGTPEECAEKLKTQIAAAGINHMILAITDRALVKALMGRELEGVPDINDQLQLVHDRVMPAFA